MENLILRNQTIIDAVSMTASYTSEPQDISSARGYAVQVVWSGATSASADTFTLSGSLDRTGTYTTISTVTVNATSGNSLINVEFPCYPYIKLAFNRTDAAAGTLTAKLSEKV
jgi:hypothetical protein